MFSRKLFTAAAAVAGLGLVLAGCAGTDDAGADPEALVLGLVPSQDVDQLVTDGDALADLLTEQLGIPVTAEITDNYAGLVVAMQTDQAQIGMFGPIGLVQAQDEAGAVPILQSVRYGDSVYVTQWFTNDPDTYCLTDIVTETDDDGVDYLYCNGTEEGNVGPLGEDALALVTQDETIAFVDEGSASGYYYPATQLGLLGLDINDLSGAFFAGGHPNAVRAVYDGDAVIGTSFNDARTSLAEETPDIGEKVVVFAHSTLIPNDGVAVSGTLSTEWQDKIADAFLAIADTEDGAAVLDAVYSIDGLVPADLEALENARAVYENFG
ncbi:phosphate/phosphite/phosphonate ABC transporter substrate-binding protein [Microbacterium sediminicola]|uniref:Phosphate/phosphite/phosphonate ABC transporter substrate-binding protein n=1 Tax=Microbacterium sediminicola TaxID=415210 RepID=A0ABN2ICQ7_9MICO